jgi:hypothetical protein
MKPFEVNNICDPLMDGSSYWRECWVFVAKGNEKFKGKTRRATKKNWLYGNEEYTELKRSQDHKIISSVLYTQPPLWSSGQSSWLQIQRSLFDSLHYQIFWEVVFPERGPLWLVSITEELLGRNSSGSGLENREYGRRDPWCWPHNTLHLQIWH